MRNRFDTQLELLNKELIEMGALCEELIRLSQKALLDDKDYIETARAKEMEVDRMESDIESLCMKLLLKQQPVARDLRSVSSALKMISDMERIGDQSLENLTEKFNKVKEAGTKQEKLCKNIYAKIKELPKDDPKRKDLISRFNTEKGKLESIKKKYTSLNSAISKLEK